MDTLDDRSIIDRLEALARPVVDTLGYQLWGIELTGGGGRRLVRIYIDSPEGVSIEACAVVSRHLSVLFDVEDPVPGAFNLEVSSPGLERPFFTFEQAAHAVGEAVEVQLREPLSGRKNFKGRLDAARDGELYLTVDGHPAVLPWSLVKKARLVITDWAAAMRASRP